MIEQHLRRAIIDHLAIHQKLRFSELKPSDMDSNAFTYHLNGLMKEGFVVKEAGAYQLSLEGLRYVDTLSFTNRRPRKQPKLISIFALQNDKREWLLAFRKRQPNIGKLMLPSGKQHYGESPEQQQRRDVTEQFGRDIDLRLRGFADIRISQSKELVTHLSARIYSGTYTGMSPEENDKFRYAWWVPDDEAGLVVGTLEIMAALESSDELFVLSLDVTDD